MAVSSGRRPAFARLALIVVGACALALLGAPGAQAATVTVGSPLTGGYFPSITGVVGTVANTALPEPAPLTSPVTGTVVRWRILDASGGPFALRVLTPGSGTEYTGGAASAAQSPLGPGVETFTTALPIQAGQTIGLDDSNTSDAIGNSEFFTGTGSATWKPPLGIGETRASFATAGNELSFNADVEYSDMAPSPIVPASVPPAATCTVPKLKGKKLKAVRKALTKADCKLGKVQGSRSGNVTKQSPKPGRVLAPGAKVNLKLG